MEMERDRFCLWVPQITGLHPDHTFGTNSRLPPSHFPLPCMIPLTFYFWLIFPAQSSKPLRSNLKGQKECLFPYSGRTVGSDQLCPPFGMQNDGLCRWRHKQFLGNTVSSSPTLGQPACWLHPWKDQAADMNKRETEMHLFDPGKILSWLHKFSIFDAVVAFHLLLLESSFSFKYQVNKYSSVESFHF